MRTWTIAGGILAVSMMASAWASVGLRKSRHVWDHFDVVKPGILYRSGELTDDQLREAVRRYGIRTIANLQMTAEGTNRERALARRLGLDFLHLPMSGDGFGREDQFREVLAAADDPARRPVLVHCARGTCRTGAAVALYRYERDGWTIEDVTAEMVRQTYRRGWLPGYVYAMVHDRPFPELFEPRVTLDPGATPGGAAPPDPGLFDPTTPPATVPEEPQDDR